MTIWGARVEEFMVLQIKYEKKTRYPGITEVGPSRYRLRVRYVDPKTGRRKQKIRVFEGTLAEAAVEQARLHGKEEQPTKQERQRLGGYAESWLECKAATVSPSTAHRLAWQIGYHIVPNLGDYWVDAITPADVRGWQAGLRASGLAPATVNSAHRTLKAILDTVVADGMLQTNPAKCVPALREGRTKGPRGTVLTPEQLGLFILTGERLVAEGEISPDLFTMLLVLALCGLRFGEAAALEWGDIRDGALHVERAVWRGHLKSTKTDDPRVVPLPEPVRERLQIQRQQLLAEQHPALGLGIVFPANLAHARQGARRRAVDDFNWYRVPSCLAKPIKLIVKSAELPAITVHSLRRTWENLLRRAGVDHMVRRAMAGWRSERAQAIYAQVDLDEAKDASERATRIVMGEGRG
jgi:integrase